MPTQTDEARDHEFMINLIYEPRRIRLHAGKQQRIKVRFGKRMRHQGLEMLGQRLAQFLVPNGYWLIGHSESLNGLNIGLRCLKPSIYQKA